MIKRSEYKVQGQESYDAQYIFFNAVTVLFNGGNVGGVIWTAIKP